ncbi:MAG: hypothetical protein K2P84_12685 [Undibacterium sp.]|nr:hypothetical protein [Undibacterium sp.]
MSKSEAEFKQLRAENDTPALKLVFGVVVDLEKLLRQTSQFAKNFRLWERRKLMARYCY